MSTVAIVMTTYNGEKYVGEQINSILNSTYQDFELFIYDDGSKDNTVSILRGFESENPSKVHVIQNEVNLGVNRNFLEAFSKTTMDYVMFCDQDDVWNSNKIAMTLKRMRHMEGQAGKVADQNLNVLYRSFFCSNHLNPRKTDLAHLLMENKLIGCTVMVNAALRKVFQSNCIPEKAKFHDWWIALIAASLGRICFINESTMLYRQHGSNVVGGADFFTYFKNRISTIKKQKESVIALENQADEFLSLYGNLLSQEKREIMICFSNLNKNSFLARRCLIIKYGYLKSGLIRNIGLFLIV